MMKGAHWQILVTLDKALDVLAGPKGGALALEGVEDVSVFANNQWTHVQAKDLANYAWREIKGVVEGFAQALGQDPKLCFELSMVEGKLTKDVEDLLKICSGEALSPTRTQEIIKRVEPLCEPYGADPLDLIHNRLTIVRRSGDQAWEDIVSKAMTVFECLEDSATMHLHYLGYSLLERASHRITIRQDELGQIVDDSKDAASTERSGFAALTSGLVERFDFTHRDATPTDFLLGKGARLGHVVAGLDVRRDRWMDELEDALAGDCSICLIMSSSGQGKSTLMYRYALEQFAQQQVFGLKACESIRDARVVCSMLAAKVKLGRSLCLLIDGADWRTSRWVEVATECSRLGIPTLVAVRREDFYRYGSRIAFETVQVEPTLTAEEAKRLHTNLKDGGKLHDKAPGWAQAFERVGEPRLFIEYIYLLTQGRLLRDRLEEQVRTLEHIQGHHYEALQLVSMAHTLGVPVQKTRLLASFNHPPNARALFEPLEGEYLAPLTSDDEVTGLHWVRSEHLAKLTHGRFASEASTFSRVLGLVHEEHALGAIEAALGRSSMEHTGCIRAIVDWVGGDLHRLIGALHASLRARARTFGIEHREALLEAFELGGVGFLSLLLVQHGITPAPLLEQMSQGNPDAGHLPALRRISASLGTPDHFAAARSIIGSLDSEHVTTWARHADLDHLGEFMDWQGLCGVEWPSGDEVRMCLERIDLSASGTPFESVLNLLQGAGRVAPEAYACWLEQEGDALANRVMIETDSTMVEYLEQESAHIAFLITPTINLDDINGEAVKRVRVLRRAYPLAETYCSSATSVMYDLLEMSNVQGQDYLERQAYKNIPKSMLPLESDIAKGTQLTREIFDLAGPNTLFTRASHWERARHLFNALLTNLVRWVNSEHVHAQNPSRNAPCPCGSHKKYKKCCRMVYETQRPDGSSVDRVLRTLPPPTNVWGDELAELERRAWEWSGAAHRFLKFLFNDRRDPYARTLLTEALDHLGSLHAFLDALATHTHGFVPHLPDDEAQVYASVLDMLDSQA
jgi:hypothetical protein